MRYLGGALVAGGVATLVTVVLGGDVDVWLLVPAALLGAALSRPRKA